LLGDTFTGKTSLVLRFAEGHYRESARSPTVGAFFVTKRLSVHGITCKVQIWDTAGQEQFRKLAPMYYRNAAAAIICYDITSPKSFETLKYWIDELQRNVSAGSIVLAMCATKLDLSPHPDTTQAKELADATGAMFITTSAKDNTNVEYVFQKVAERVLQFQRQHMDGTNIPVTLGTTASHGHPAYAQSILPLSPPEEKKSESDPTLDDDEITVDKLESKDSSTSLGPQCGASMLCVDEGMMGADGKNCKIM
jgi:small GTP-binding protein